MVDQSSRTVPSSSLEPPLVTPAQRTFAVWLVHILGSVVVLNIFEEHVDSVVIDSFSLSLLVAIVLRVALEGAIWIERQVAEFWDKRSGTAAHGLKIVTAWVVLFLSKLVILELIDVIFGDHVDLGGLLTFIALVVALIGTEALLKLAFDALGRGEQQAT